MSRRAAEEAMVAGRVKLNGNDVVLGDRVDVEGDVLTVDGVPLAVNPKLETHLVYKPTGVISTADDPEGRPTVVDLVSTQTRLYPVGRLDADSEGLILVTNDGELTHRVTHPRFGVTKTYVVAVTGVPSPSDVRKLRDGVALEDGPAKAIGAKLLDSNDGQALLELVMGEGRNREVRRMMESIGYPVKSLVRVAIGQLRDPNLRPGGSRALTAADIRRIFGE